MRKVYRDVAGPCLTPDGSVVCIGAFDGVHRGHREVLERVRARAEELRATPVAVTFAPIPRVFFGQAVPQLTTVREKIAALIDAGMQRVLLVRFNADFAAMSAEDFIQRVLVERLAAREVWVGEGFRFGHDRRGDLALLRRVGAEDWMSADVVPPYSMDGERVSSSRIRTALAAGDMGSAERLLGRHFSMGGRVVHGEQIGRKLGCPTANVRLGDRIAPLGGIFAVRIHGVGEQVRPGVASLGVRPTINGTEPLLEAHVFDWNGDLYGKRIEVEFVKKIRNEEKFPDLAAMAQQISRDVSAARIILGVAERARVGVKS
ncbi:MAG TPA: bifunctional riboflavin kinase/FAD synthetase [Rudaea sp.]|nr:bifunctional riboflavin kinase/FAD synthetase [Rudaea sp.]